MVLVWSLVAAGIIAVAVVPRVLTIDWLERHEKLAGWFQGVIAVVAIVGVFLVARYQTQAEARRSKDEQRQAKRDKFFATAGSLHHFEACFFIAQEEIRNWPPNWKSINTEFDSARETTRALLTQPFELPHPELVWRLSTVAQHLRASQAYFIRMSDAPQPDVVGAVLEVLESYRIDVHQLILWCADHARQLSTEEEYEEMGKTLRKASETANG